MAGNMNMSSSKTACVISLIMRIINILEQGEIATLAQTNKSKQGVLGLLG